MSTTSPVSMFTFGSLPKRQTVGSSRKQTRLIRKLAQERNEKIVQVMKDTYKGQR